MQITETHYLVLSVALLLIGTVGVLTRRNIVKDPKNQDRIAG